MDASGELQDFEAPREDEYEYQILDQAQRIQEYLEESGATSVRLKINDPLIGFKFTYNGLHYLLSIDLDSETSKIEAVLRSDSEPILIYSDSTDSLFDILATRGLDFLRY